MEGHRQSRPVSGHGTEGRQRGRPFWEKGRVCARAQGPTATGHMGSSAIRAVQGSRQKQELDKNIQTEVVCHSKESRLYHDGNWRTLPKGVAWSFLFQKDHSSNSTVNGLKRERIQEQR